MTLHEAIQKVLKENGQPVHYKDIASSINSNGYYVRQDNKPLESRQILGRIRNYPNLFQNINGQIILIEDVHWKNLLTSYWYLANILRGIFINADIQFIIAILFFYKRQADINNRVEKGLSFNFLNGFDSSIEQIMNGGNSWVENMGGLESYCIAPVGVFEECSRLLTKLDSHKKIEIWSLISHIDTSQFDDNKFGNIYEYFLNFDSLDGYKSSITNTPYSLRELMVELLAPEPGKSIYDPVCGIGGLLIDASNFLNKNAGKAIGTEINKRTAQLGNLNLISHGLNNISIKSSDCFEEINNPNEYDYIIADLPVNGITNSIEHFMLYSQWELEPPKSGKGFGSLVLFVLSKMNYTGKAVITVSDSFLVKKGKEKEIRDLLIRRDTIESVISLPYGALRPYTEAKASIVILNKNKPSHLRGKIRFITGRATDHDKKFVDLDIENIVRSYNRTDFFATDTQLVDISNLRNDTNLSAEAYDAQFMLGSLMLKEGSGKMLSELVEIKAGVLPDKVDVSNDGDIQLVKIENLSRDILDIRLTNQINSRINFSPKYLRAVIKDECILVARIGDNSKPTIFRPDQNQPRIIPHSGIYSLMPLKRNKEIDIEYLYYQLHTSYVKEQIQKRKLGAVMPHIGIASLGQVIIPYTSLKSQIAFVESQKASLIAEERYRVEERIKALGYKEEVKQTESDIVRTLVHQLRPTLVNIDFEVKKLKRIIDKNGIGLYKEGIQSAIRFEDIEIDGPVKEVHDYTVNEIVGKLKEDTLRLNDVLTTVNKVMSFKLTPQDMEPVDLLSFFSEYLQLKKIDIAEKFQINVAGDHFTVEINKASFRELIDQLLLNAEKHGFKNSKVPVLKRRVEFSIKRNKERGVAIIEYQNNGEPFRLLQEDFIKPFHKDQRSDGSGIGGNYIYRIMQSHGGSLLVKEGGKAGFAIVFELKFNQNKEYE